MTRKVSNNKRVSSIDVAKEAGVSQSTVSRVFNNNHIKIAPETSEKVFRAAEKLGYSPSMIARSLSKQSTNIIGIVMKQFENPFHMKSLQLFTNMFQERNYSVMVFNSSAGDFVEENLRKAMEYNVAGLIITSAKIDSLLVEWCAGFDTSIFLFDRISNDTNVNSICCDNYNGGRLIADYLIDRGHTKLSYISGDMNSSPNRDRMNGFFSRADEREIKNITMVEGKFSYDSGWACAQELISKGEKIDAVFCASDLIALGFIHYINSCTSLGIPEDISLIGFDGIRNIECTCNQFTTYKQSLEKMVETTVNLMLSNILENKKDAMHYLISGKIEDNGTVLDKMQKKVLTKN